MLTSFLWQPTLCPSQSIDEHRAPTLNYSFAGHSRQTSSSFEPNANKVYLPIEVNGRGPYWFILDTGSISNVLDTETAKGLGVPLRDSFEASGAGEKTITGAIGSSVTLSISQLEIKQSEIDVDPINASISAAEGRRVDGLLGYDFLNRFVVDIDYVHRQVTIFDPSGFHYTGSGATIPLETIRGNIFISISLTMPNGKQVPGIFLIDTAWRSALTLTSPFARRLGLMTTLPRTVDAVTGMGIGGATVDTVARMPSLNLGRYTIQNFVASFSHAKAGVLSQDDFAGIIGAEILRRFRVIFDYPHHRMIVEPNAMFGAPYEFDMSGLFVIREGGPSGVFKIYSVVRGSPAAEAGLQEGDIIEAIDDRPASDFTLEQVRQMFKEQEGKQHSLTVKRDGRVVTTRLRLRRII